MPRPTIWITAGIIICFLGATSSAVGQQTTVTAPMQGMGDSFSEGIGVGFGMSGRNWFFNNGGARGPAFGGFDPSAGANLGFGFGFPGGNGFVNIGAAQGSSRSMSSTAGSLTVPNGGQGFFSDTTLRPFVTGVVPVVGGFADSAAPRYGLPGTPAREDGYSTLLEERMSRIRESGGLKMPLMGSGHSGNSTLEEHPTESDGPELLSDSAGRQSSASLPIVSVAELRKQQARGDAALDKEIKSLLDRGHEAQAAGKTAVARIYYQQAARRGNGALKQKAEDAIRSLGDSAGIR